MTRIRYITRIFTLDRFFNGVSSIDWDNDHIKDIFEYEEKHSGLKIISSHKEVSIVIEYTNIIWNYKVFWGSYKKKYKPITNNDERWKEISFSLTEDLKMIGLDFLHDDILNALKRKQYFEYNEKMEVQFKRYCI